MTLGAEHVRHARRSSSRSSSTSRARSSRDRFRRGASALEQLSRMRGVFERPRGRDDADFATPRVVPPWCQLLRSVEHRQRHYPLVSRYFVYLSEALEYVRDVEVVSSNLATPTISLLLSAAASLLRSCASAPLRRSARVSFCHACVVPGVDSRGHAGPRAETVGAGGISSARANARTACRVPPGPSPSTGRPRRLWRAPAMSSRLPRCGRSR